MGRRRSGQQEIEMGSDSFLDVIANIVGILIILIVIAGIRVSQSPLPLMSINSEAVEEKSVPEVVPEPILLEEPEVTEIVVPAPVPELDRELLKQVREQEAELTALQSESSKTLGQLQSHQNRIQSVGDEVHELQDKIKSLVLQKEESEDQLISLRKVHARSEQEVNEITRVLEETLTQTPDVKPLEHKVTPVSKKIQGTEVHFQILHNRVAYLPVDELLGRMKQDVGKRIRWLAKYNRHVGYVGPVRGFTMKYTVQRQALTQLEQLRTAGSAGALKIAVTRWELTPEELLEAESLKSALKPGSQFQRAVLDAPSDATLTFWVYPDSFDTFQKVKEAAHQNGFIVAARPIPFGTPIAGSPSGSRSSGQ